MTRAGEGGMLESALLQLEDWMNGSLLREVFETELRAETVALQETTLANASFEGFAFSNHTLFSSGLYNSTSIRLHNKFARHVIWHEPKGRWSAVHMCGDGMSLVAVSAHVPCWTKCQK